MTRSFIALIAILCLAAGAPAVGASDLAVIELATTPDTLRTYATLHSLGFEWDILGDTDHDAACTVRYRAAGSPEWRSALDLLRVDFQGFFGRQRADRHYNMLAGSIFFLQPGTTYEVELTLNDPDGDGHQRRVELATRPLPGLPQGPLFYVHAGAGSGDGALLSPLSLEAALSQAAPGQRYCLLPGHYGEAALSRPGGIGQSIAWLGPEAARAAAIPVAAMGDAVFQRLEVGASHQWIEGLRFEWAESWPDSLIRGALKATAEATDVVVQGNHFEGYAYSIWLMPGSDDWVIADNTIVGRKDIELEGSVAYSGEGIELQHSSGHTVAYNTITQVADGISYAQRNCDIFGNDIYDTSDDGIEPDYGYANIRIWDNRIANTHYHAFSFQGMHCGPWYFVRNQVTTARGAIYKFRVTDRIVLVNNTFVAPTLGRDITHHLLHAYARNNLYVRDGAETDGEPWLARLKYRGESIEKGYYNPDLTGPDWRTDWDYSGYDLRGADGSIGDFVWFDRVYDTVQDLAAAVGIETHGRRIDRETTFAGYAPPTHPARRPGTVLALRPEGDAVDAGTPVPNLADIYSGESPDLGAHEVGLPLPHYGARGRANRSRWLR